MLVPSSGSMRYDNRMDPRALKLVLRREMIQIWGFQSLDIHGFGLGDRWPEGEILRPEEHKHDLRSEVGAAAGSL